MVSSYKISVIQQIKRAAEQNHKTGEWHLSGSWFRGMEPDSVLTFATWSSMIDFIIQEVTKE